eukprot:986183-Prymnesium_polylepis.1
MFNRLHPGVGRTVPPSRRPEGTRRRQRARAAAVHHGRRATPHVGLEHPPCRRAPVCGERLRRADQLDPAGAGLVAPSWRHAAAAAAAAAAVVAQPPRRRLGQRGADLRERVAHLEEREAAADDHVAHGRDEQQLDDGHPVGLGPPIEQVRAAVAA